MEGDKVEWNEAVKDDEVLNIFGAIEKLLALVNKIKIVGDPNIKACGMWLETGFWKKKEKLSEKVGVAKICIGHVCDIIVSWVSWMWQIFIEEVKIININLDVGIKP